MRVHHATWITNPMRAATWLPLVFRMQYNLATTILKDSATLAGHDKQQRISSAHQMLLCQEHYLPIAQSPELQCRPSGEELSRAVDVGTSHGIWPIYGVWLQEGRMHRSAAVRIEDRRWQAW